MEEFLELEDFKRLRSSSAKMKKLNKKQSSSFMHKYAYMIPLKV